MSISTREKRIFVLLVLIWVIGMFDLIFTGTAQFIGGFEEANPIARNFVDTPWKMIFFKLSLMVTASYVIWITNHKFLTEILTWFVAAIYIGLAFEWNAYYLIIWNII